MKKALIVSLVMTLSLTGCYGQNKVNGYSSWGYSEYDTEVAAEELKNKDPLELIEVKDNNWRKIERAIEQKDALNDRFETEDVESDLWSGWGVALNSHIQHYNIQEQEDRNKVIEVIKKYIGIDLTKFMEMSSRLREGEHVESIFNDYGFVLYNAYGELGMYIIDSGFQLKNENIAKWVEEVGNDQIMLHSVSVGKEKQYYELCTPSFIVDTIYTLRSKQPMVSYGIFVDATGKITKIQTVIKTSNDNSINEKYIKGLTKEILQPLNNMLTSLDVSNADQIVEEMIETAEGKQGKVTKKEKGYKYDIETAKKWQEGNIMEAVFEWE